MRILTIQSADRPSVDLFSQLLPAALNSHGPRTLWVPNYLEKAFLNIIPFIHARSKIIPYRNICAESGIPDWVVIQTSMLGLVTEQLATILDKLTLVHRNDVFVLLQKKGIGMHLSLIKMGKSGTKRRRAK